MPPAATQNNVNPSQGKIYRMLAIKICEGYS